MQAERLQSHAGATLLKQALIVNFASLFLLLPFDFSLYPCRFFREMHAQIIYNHRLVKRDAACLPAVSAASLYGRGVFTTVAIYRSHPFLWLYHWQRLINHAERLKLDLSEIDEASVLKSLKRLIKANNVEHGRARVS